MNPEWSPDGKWIAYARLLDNHLKVIKAHNVETGETLQLTDGMSDAIAPVWDESGKYLYFLASTDFGLNTAWLDMTSYEHPDHARTVRHRTGQRGTLAHVAQKRRRKVETG